MPLYDFQKKGVDFLRDNKTAMLLDHTGTGKTIQMVSACYREGLTPLVICPKSVQSQWVSEARKWAGWCSTVPSGAKTERAAQYKRRADMYVLNYEKVLVDKDLIDSLPYDCVILDEAQRIRNPATRTAQVCKALRRCERRYVTTATPVQNRVKDFLSLTEFVSGRSASFIANSAVPVSRGSYTGYVDPRMPVDPSKRMGYVARRYPGARGGVSIPTLRRTKDQVDYAFPDRTENWIHCYLDQYQADVYDMALNALVISVGDKLKPIEHVLALITYLREICDSTLLVDPRGPPASCKMDEMLPLVSEIVGNGHKVLIFSEFKRMTDLVVFTLRAIGYQVAYIHGGMKRKDIDAQVSFLDGEAQVMVATRAAEEGLNLQAANYVINLEPPFNPARLLQRSDRVHRIGQTKPVFVYNFIVEDTYEMRIKDILNQKDEIARKVIDEGRDPDGFREYILGLVAPLVR